MRRKIELYINGLKADIDDDSYILFNYTAEDTRNPAIVKNSYTKQITLKGTPANNAIFGRYFRLDATIDGYNPLNKVPFKIYNERSEILESGYVRMDNVIRSNNAYTYAVTLFGGLGEFFYSLAYDSAGNQRQLSDLQYIEDSESSAEELNFNITKEVIRDAWARINGDSTKSDLWDIINFVPAYNGLPKKGFDAGKCLLYATDAALPAVSGYTTKSGWSLVKMSAELTEWEMQDIRCYLQRPALRVKSLIEAISNPDNNGGWNVNLDSGFFSSSNPYYNDSWIVLPVLNTINLIGGSGNGSITPVLGRIDIPDGGDSASTYNISLAMKPRISSQSIGFRGGYMNVDGEVARGEEQLPYHFCNWAIFTITAYDNTGAQIGQYVKRCSTRSTVSGETPTIDVVGTMFNSAGNWVGSDISFSFTLTGVSYITIAMAVDGATWGRAGEEQGIPEEPQPTKIWRNNTAYTPNDEVAYSFVGVSGSYTWSRGGNARSGARITKADLLQTEKTPADYLLSYCKMFNLRFVCHKDSKTIDILNRYNYFQMWYEYSWAYKGIDIDELVATSKEIKKTPLGFSDKWLDWEVENSAGEYAAKYYEKYGITFGRARVNTGYDFSSSAKSVLESVIYKGACEVLEKSQYFVRCSGSGKTYMPPAFTTIGSKYILWNNSGEESENDVPALTARDVVLPYYNLRPYFDNFSKIQLHSEDNSAEDIRDVLVFYRGSNNSNSQHYSITDDTQIMLAVNGGTPCWIGNGSAHSAGISVTAFPMFGRYKINVAGTQITKSWDCGTPKEVQLPDVTFASNSNIYDQYWKAYINDRYNANTSMLKCWIDMSKWNVNEDTLRKAYHYNGCEWFINEIKNHSLTTYDPTEVELVKINDIEQY